MASKKTFKDPFEKLVPARDIQEPVETVQPVVTAAVKTARKVFSFRAEPEKINAWKIYAEAAGMKMEDLGEAAFAEYMKNHALTADQQKLFDLKAGMKK